MSMGESQAMTEAPTWIVVTHALLPNGAAHRLVRSLQARGRSVAFCALPLPGGSRRRAEELLPPESESIVLVNEAGPVRPWEEARVVGALGHFTRRVAALHCERYVLVACDPLAYSEARLATRVLGPRKVRRAVWLVDWSAQRLRHPVPGSAYRVITSFALHDADEAAVISVEAASALAQLAPSGRKLSVLPNQPLRLGSPRAWTERPERVAYLGGLSDVQGAKLLVELAHALSAEGVGLEIAGDGPARASVEAAVAGLRGVRVHGLVEQPASLATVLASCRVGLALYDPTYEQHSYGDPLKVKDYLAAGLRVITTLPRLCDGNAVRYAELSLPSVLDATQQALRDPLPTGAPPSHPLLRGAEEPLEAFIGAVEGQA